MAGMGAVLAFAISLTLLVLFLAFKYWETRRGRLVAAVVRANADTRLLALGRYLKEEAPHVVSYLMAGAVVAALRAVAHFIYSLVKTVRSGVARATGMLERRNEIAGRGSASYFLRSVSEHKNGLTRKPRDPSV